MKFLGALSSLTLLACSDSVGPARAGERLQTDATAYIARHISGETPYEEYGFQLITLFHNAESDTVFIDRCFPTSPKPLFSISLISPSNDEGAAYDGDWSCVGHENPIAVAPGADRVDTLLIKGPMARDGRTKRPFGVFEGVFRISYYVDTCRREVACSYPRDAGKSNTFRITLE